MRKIENFMTRLGVVMKISLIHITAIFLSSAYTYGGGDANAQDVLNKQISIELPSTDIKTVLAELENKARVKFVYSSRLVPLSRKVTLKVTNQSIAKILDELFKPDKVTYNIVNNRIVLNVVEQENNLLLQVPAATSAESALDKTVSGKVIDEKGEGLPGVSIVVKGTQAGSISDVNGNYSVKIQGEGGILVFSFVGYVSREEVVGDRTSLDVSLQVDEKGLDELVVVGYGTVKKRDLTGAVTRISPDAYKAQPVQGIAEMLRGNAPGVMVKTNGDGSTRIRIRGTNSLNGNNDPLYIVDGVPMGSYSPNDVESIEVLKDASATAIYGSRGANGVVLITTRRGKSGAPVVQVSANTSFATYPRFYDLLNGPEFADYYNSYFGRNINFDRSVDTDWQRVTTQTGFRQNYQANISGGNDQVKFYVGGNFIDNTGLIKNQSNKTYRLRSNIDFKLGSKFTGRIDLSGGQNRAHGSSITGKGALFSALQWAPSTPIYDANGNYVVTDPFGITTTVNPYFAIMEGNENSYETNVAANGYFAYEVIPGLKLSAQPSVSKSIGEGRNFTPALLTSTGQSTALRSTSNTTTWQLTGLATYDKVLGGKHNLNAMLGAEAWSMQNDSYGSTAMGVSYDYMLWYNLASSSIKDVSSGYSGAQLASFFARANYNFDSKYYVTVSMRADGSSKFRGNNQFSYFPSGALSWVVSNEEFLKNNEWLNHLKLRASYGVTGSQAINSYATIAALRNRRNWSWGTGNRVQGVELNAPVNTNLRWEATRQMDIGLDANLFNKWSVSLDYYHKVTDGLLTQRQLPDYAGAGTTLINLGEMQNKGIDASVTFTPYRTKDFNWQMTANASRMINNVVSLGEIGEYFIPADDANFTGVQLEMSPLIVQQGQSLGQMFGYRWLGLWSTSEAEEAAKYNQKPGDNKYFDANKNYKYDNDDREVIGNFMPKFNWSYNTTVQWKNFDFNLLVEGTHGQDMYNFNRMVAGTVVGMSGSINLREAADKVWTPTNQNTMWSPNSTSALEKANSSKWVEKADWVKLRNISLGYTIPKYILKGQELRFNVSLQNALTITNYKGMDPEAAVNGGRNADMYGGVEYGTYPSPRIYTVGLNFKF
jgi:TonB-linked SusC/RagA family outer membrane protein